MKRLFLKSIFIFISLFFINIRAVFPFNTTFDSIIKIDTITKSNDLLLDKISYEASDTVSINPKNKTIRLYNNAKINYQDMQITAGIIIVDYNKNEIYAGRIKDSSGIYTQLPVFVQGNDEVNPDSLKFNFDTKKAIIFNSRTEEAGLKIISDITKKENDSVYYMNRAKFTTSENIENPEYYFLLRKAKVIPGKKNYYWTNKYVYCRCPNPNWIALCIFSNF